MQNIFGLTDVSLIYLVSMPIKAFKQNDDDDDDHDDDDDIIFGN